MITHHDKIKNLIESVQFELGHIAQSCSSEVVSKLHEISLRLDEITETIPKFKSVADECPPDGKWILYISKHKIEYREDRPYLNLFDIDSYKTTRVKINYNHLDLGEAGSIPLDKLDWFDKVYWIPLEPPYLIEQEKTEELLSYILEKDGPDKILQYRKEYADLVAKLIEEKNGK